MSKQKSAFKNIKADYYEGYFTQLPVFEKLKPNATFLLDSVLISSVVPRVKDHFAVRFRGSFSIPETDVYRFFLESYDGSKLIIDGKEIWSSINDMMIVNIPDIDKTLELVSKDVYILFYEQ